MKPTIFCSLFFALPLLAQTEAPPKPAPSNVMNAQYPAIYADGRVVFRMRSAIGLFSGSAITGDLQTINNGVFASAEEFNKKVKLLMMTGATGNPGKVT